MKNFFSEWIILILTLAGLALFLSIKPQKVEKYNNLLIDKNVWSNIIEGREKSTKNLIQKISFNNEELITAVAGEDWYYSLIEGDKEALNPDVKIIKATPDVKVAFLDGEITNKKIQDGEIISVVAYTESEYDLHKLSVTTIPLLAINYDGPEDLAKEDGEKNISFKLFNNRAESTKRVVVSGGKIKVHGASTALYPKKSYKISLKTNSSPVSQNSNQQSLLDMRKDNDWLLYAGYNDQEKIRNVFATNLWKDGQAKENEFGLDNGVEYKYIELIMNDKYHGLYALGYPIDELVLDLKKNMDGDFEEYSFKKVLWDGNNENALDTYELKTRIINPQEAWKNLEDFDYEIKNGSSVDRLRQITDIKNAINVHLFVELAQSTDTVSGAFDETKNLYFTSKIANNGRKWVFTPWDMDLTFGNDWKKTYNLSPDENIIVMGDVIARLEKLGDEKIRYELKKEYNKLRSNTWTKEYFLRKLNEYEKQIYKSGAFNRDKERWPGGNYNNPEEELSVFKNYVIQRIAAMDAKYSEM